jgi:hypothetical protein
LFIPRRLENHSTNTSKKRASGITLFLSVLNPNMTTDFRVFSCFLVVSAVDLSCAGELNFDAKPVSRVAAAGISDQVGEKSGSNNIKKPFQRGVLHFSGMYLKM